jgi:hypothetical protein
MDEIREPGEIAAIAARRPQRVPVHTKRRPAEIRKALVNGDLPLGAWRALRLAVAPRRNRVKASSTAAARGSRAKSQGDRAMDAWMGLAMIVEVLLLSVVVALMLTWSALRAVFHLMPASVAAPRLAPALATRRGSASVA